MDLQTDDDYWPFLALWAAAAPDQFQAQTQTQAQGQGQGQAGALEGGPPGAPGLAQVAQSLASAQLQSVQRLRQVLGAQADALRAAL